MSQAVRLIRLSLSGNCVFAVRFHVQTAFYNCTGLSNIKLPKAVTNIYANAFTGCSCLTDVYYMGSESEWAAIDINTPNVELLGAVMHYDYIPEDSNHFVFPSSLTIIESEAFVGVPIGETIYLPNGITYVAPDAFDENVHNIIISEEETNIQ